MKFATFIKKQIRGSYNGKSNNYQHTHDRVHFNNDTHFLSLEEVCVNEYGSCYGRDIGFFVGVPTSVEIPEVLTGEGLKYFDFEDARFLRASSKKGLQPTRWN
jgi:hypothetical protein